MSGRPGQTNLGGNPLAQQVAIVTGGAQGIGKNIVRMLALAGAKVVICDVNAKGGLTTQQEFRQQGLAVTFAGVDLSRRGAPQGMVTQVVREHGRLDILVNNACSRARTSLLEETEDTWEQGLSVTLKAPFFAAQAAIRAMSANGGGTIVNIASVAGLFVCHESPTYHIAKAGLIQMTRYLAVHAGAHGVRVNAVVPGFIVQDEHRGRYEGPDNQRYRQVAESCHPAGRVGTSDDVANAVLYLCASDAAFISGHCLTVDGGLTLQDPSSLALRLDAERPSGGSSAV